MNESTQKLIISTQKSYESSNDTTNILLVGDYGTGKTTMLRTCRTPVYVSSFDPGGTKLKTLESFYKAGHMQVDLFEKEDNMQPVQWTRFKERAREYLHSGLLNNIGTWYIDSFTSLSEACMNYVLATNDDKRGDVKGQNPAKQDYGRQQMLLRDMLKQLVCSPCNVVLTAHIYMKDIIDEKTGEVVKVVPTLMTSGKLKTKIPILFDEVWLTRTEFGPNGQEYWLQTIPDPYYPTRTRIGTGIFSKKEPQDIKALLKKAGKPFHDLPPLLQTQEDTHQQNS